VEGGIDPDEGKDLYAGDAGIQEKNEK